MGQKHNISQILIIVLAIACGIIAANLYYTQPIIATISHSLNMPLQMSGFIVTITQFGYGIGLLFIVPLADRYENKSLMLLLIVSCSIVTVGLSLLNSSILFLIMSFIVGITAVAAQIIVPYASHLAPETVRGRVVGNVMCGLMLGIMLSRPVASFITEFSSWRVVFLVSAFFMWLLSITFWFVVPKRNPVNNIRYIEILKSMKYIVLTEPILRRRAIYQAIMFGVFSLFWTTVPLLLLGPRFGFSNGGVALFALAGASGVIAAPIAGQIADKDRVKQGTGIAMIISVFAFAVTFMCGEGSFYSVCTLLISAILLDFATTSNLVFGQREIFILDAGLRSRFNAIYMATFFIGGSISSAVGAWVYNSVGWSGIAIIGTSLPLVAFLYFLSE